MKKNELAKDTADREIVVTRAINAPRELVFKAWTDPAHIAGWWGPDGFTNTIHEMEVKPGGVWRFIMHGPNGMDFPNRVVFTEVVFPEKLVYDHGSDVDNDPGQFHVTVTFESMGKKTWLTMRSVFSTAAQREMVVKEYGALEGAHQNLNRFEAYLYSSIKTEATEDFVLSRTYNAPRELVFKAWTEPERMAQWWGPKGFTMQTAHMYLRPGGSYLYNMRSPEGHEMSGKFVYREVAGPGRLVFVVSFTDKEGTPIRHPMAPTWPLEVLNILTLTEEGGSTTLTLSGWPINATEEEHNTFNSARAGMQQGFTGTFDQLEAYLTSVTS